MSRTVVVAVRGAGQLVARFAKKGRFAVARGRGSGHGSGEVWRVIVAADVGTAGRGGSRVGGSGKEWSFGFSVVVGRTCAVAGTSFGANFTGAIDPSMFFVATANAVVRAAGAVPGTFVGATTHTAIQRAPPLHAIALGAIDVVVGLAMAVAGADRSSVGGRARFLVAQSTGPRLAWKIGGFPGGGVFLDRVAFAELGVFVAAAVHHVPKVATVPGVPVFASAGALVGAGTMVVAIVRARFGLAPCTGPPTGAHAGLIGALTTMQAQGVTQFQVARFSGKPLVANATVVAGAVDVFEFRAYAMAVAVLGAVVKRHVTPLPSKTRGTITNAVVLANPVATAEQGAQFGLALGARVTGVAHAGGNAFGVSGGPMVGGRQEGQWKNAGRCGWVGIGHFCLFDVHASQRGQRHCLWLGLPTG